MINKNGLSSEEAARLLQQNGPNKLDEEKPKTIFQMFFEQMWNFTTLIMLVAIGISIFLQDYSEAVIIGIVVLANGIIGVVQEGKAQKALEALRKMSMLKATVIRDGETIEISSEDLVVGDLVVLEAGKQIPADLRLIETVNLKIDEKALTGESVPVEKDCDVVSNEDTPIGDRFDKAFMSTVVTNGRGLGIVENVGMKTEIGHIATMVTKEKDKQSPLQLAMDGLSKKLGIICVLICIVVFAVGTFIQHRDSMEMLMLAVSLAVAAIPEGIPTIVTIVMALGMTKMAKLNAIVKNLAAVETLGAVSFVCSDKTGTLTQNKMTVVKAFTNFNYVDLEKLDYHPSRHLIRGLLLCCDASVAPDGTEIGDPTEVALVNFAAKFGKNKKTSDAKYPRVNEHEFDSDRKLMTTVHMYKDGTISYTKGSTDELLKRCTKILVDGEARPITENDKKLIMNAMSEMSYEALRVLSLALRINNKDAEENDLTYVGMVGMIDPEREEVIESVQVFKEAGVSTIMITGDHKDTALAIAKKLGIANNEDECIMGAELNEMSDETLAEKVKKLRVFARVSPEHKVRIVKALQANGYIVSMTGDGVNDSPSLKAANVGVAMGITGTDVAKGAADIILQDDKFTTIEKAIKEGRNIYENIKKSIIFAISTNISEIIAIFTTILIGLPSPLKAMHILWINLLTDSLPCFALGVDPNSSSNVMKKKPRKENEGIFANGGLSMVIAYGILIAFVILCAFLFQPIKYLIDSGSTITWSNVINAYGVDDVLMKSQTYAFCAFALMELFQAVAMRDLDRSIFKFNMLDNKMMLIALAVGLGAQLLVTEIPFLAGVFGVATLSIVEWLCLALLSATTIVMHEIFVVIRKKSRKY